MKLRMAGVDYTQDVLSAPSDDALASERYSEWYHFTFADDREGISGVINFGLFGDVRDRERGRASLSLVVHEHAHRWSGTVDVYGPEEARFTSGTIGLGIGPSEVRYVDGRYVLAAQLKDRSVAIDATWTPRTEATRIENIGGFVSTFIVPRSAVNGVVRVGGRSVKLRNAEGYHDHNWGAWDWGSDVGWNWGYLLEPGARRDPRNAIVFGQVTDARRETARTEVVLLRWRGAKLAQVFLDDSVTLRPLGRLTLEAPRVPGVMALLAPGRIGSVPEQLAVVARDGADELRIDCRVRDAIHFLIPHPVGSTHTNVAELVGHYTVRGQIEGEPIAFERTAFAELAGAGQPADHPCAAAVV